MKTVHKLARGLGWFSIILGLGELAGGEQMDETFGTRDRRNLYRVFGLREIAVGIGALVAKYPTPWIWGRVAGDALDLAALGESLRLKTVDRQNLAIAIAAVAGVTALDVFCALKLSEEG